MRVLIQTDLPEPVAPAIKKVWHLGNICNNYLSADILTYCKGKAGFMVLKRVGVKKFS